MERRVEQLLAGMCYLSVFALVLPVFKRSRFVVYHALQGAIIYGLSWVLAYLKSKIGFNVFVMFFQYLIWLLVIQGIYAVVRYHETPFPVLGKLGEWFFEKMPFDHEKN